ncbi:MAG: pirin-like C-terminal cupin domain-containing protein [Lacinutrix sp.]|uniref:pirin family protein n=1 Tax=Lacinutrix sp. TaxID=1937692 RepID=UPI00309BE0FF
MIEANYQHGKHEDFNVITSADKKIETRIIAGELESKYSKIGTQTAVNAYMIDAKAGGEQIITYANSHQGLIYLLKGKATINGVELLELDKNQLMEFNQDGEGFSIKAEENCTLLFLSGEPINEAVATYGPYVMNSQTELLEAMRDYQMGKIGFLPAN